jgi:hypothetical protein
MDEKRRDSEEQALKNAEMGKVVMIDGQLMRRKVVKQTVDPKTREALFNFFTERN